jgi:glycosyltransferase involved in cell wall biosynthesis
MRVGLNMIFYVPRETGGLAVAGELVARALGERADLEVTAFVPEEARFTDFGIERIVLPVRARRRVEWVAAEQLLLPRVARRIGCDVVHSLASTAPARGPFKRVVTIHDLNYRIVPEAHFGARALGMRLLVPLAARRSDRIVTVSQRTRLALRVLLGVDDRKIDVIPHGVAAPGEATNGAELRERHSLGERPVALVMSGKRRHKNLERVLDALALIPPERRPLLVIPGYATPYEKTLRTKAERLGISSDVRLLPWLENPDVEGLFKLSACLVHASAFEGFGLPVLEAMRRGTPVACAAVEPLSEVAGDAAAYFDPYEPPQIAAAIERLVSDRQDAARLSRAGRLRAKQFSAGRMADLIVSSYHRALGG